jgi:uncharacterized protein (DUF2141 family)
MNRFTVALILFTLFQISAKGQVTLKIVITNLQNNEGRVILDFKDINDKEIKAFYEKIVNKQCIITINNLKPGNYSFKYFHDKNNNNKLDTNLIGIPKEGFGFANNAMNKFGPPDFQKTVFEVKKDTTLVCKANYMNF